MLKNTENKNIVQILVRDTSGCSHVRHRWNSLYIGGHEHLNINPIISPIPLISNDILSNTKAVIFQRFLSDEDANIVRIYKSYQPKFQYKMIWEVDDMVFSIDGESVPEYNTASLDFNNKVVTFDNNLKEILPLMDEIIVSTDYLAKEIRKKFKVENIKVIRNVVPRFLWSKDRKKHIETDLKKPRIVYTGSPCHYRTPVPINRDPRFQWGLSAKKGDWNDAMIEFIKKNVKEDKIEFIIMGGLPFFFEDIVKKIKFVDWVDCNSYPRTVMSLNADFQLAPLVNNKFNKCKSSLRFTESCASGSIMLGTVFNTDKDSPYEEIHDECKIKETDTVKDIDEKFWKLCKKEKYNEILDWQYDFINKNGYWVESERHLNEMISVFDGKCEDNLI